MKKLTLEKIDGAIRALNNSNAAIIERLQVMSYEPKDLTDKMRCNNQKISVLEIIRSQIVEWNKYIQEELNGKTD